MTIPVFRARCSRITPPFATVPLLEPFDLHVLGTPPAFVLSHDQTLREELFGNGVLRAKPAFRWFV